MSTMPSFATNTDISRFYTGPVQYVTFYWVLISIWYVYNMRGQLAKSCRPLWIFASGRWSQPMALSDLAIFSSFSLLTQAVVSRCLADPSTRGKRTSSLVSVVCAR